MCSFILTDGLSWPLQAFHPPAWMLLLAVLLDRHACWRSVRSAAVRVIPQNTCGRYVFFGVIL